MTELDPFFEEDSRFTGEYVKTGHSPLTEDDRNRIKRAITASRASRIPITNKDDYFGWNALKTPLAQAPRGTWAGSKILVVDGKEQWRTADNGVRFPLLEGKSVAESFEAHLKYVRKEKNPKKVEAATRNVRKQSAERLAHSEANEYKAAGEKEGLGHGAVKQARLAPFDVILGKNGFEVKTIEKDALHDKITMHGTDPEDQYGSLGRKLDYAASKGITSNVIVYNEKTTYPDDEWNKGRAGQTRSKSIWFGTTLGNFRTHGKTSRASLQQISSKQLNQIGAAASKGKLTDKIVNSILGRG